jgi:hypothetical protein
MRSLLLCLVLASCGGSPQPAPTSPPASNTAPVTATPPPDASVASVAIAKMGEFKDAMCACKDTSCAQRVSDNMVKWAQDQAGNSPPPKMTDDEMKRATTIAEQMGICMQTAMSGDVPRAGAKP